MLLPSEERRLRRRPHLSSTCRFEGFEIAPFECLQYRVVSGACGPFQCASFASAPFTCSGGSNEPKYAKIGAFCCIWWPYTAVLVFGDLKLAPRSHRCALPTGMHPTANTPTAGAISCRCCMRGVADGGEAPVRCSALGRKVLFLGARGLLPHEPGSATPGPPGPCNCSTRCPESLAWLCWGRG